jgi:quercetin dioxygenase-like cupin family protein
MNQESSPYFRRVPASAVFAPDRMRASDLLTGSHLQAQVAAFEPGHSHDSHAHGGADQAFAVLAGRGRFTVGGESRVLEPGDLALAPAGVAHAIVADGGERLVVLVLTSPPTGPATVVETFEATPAPALAGAAADAAVDGRILSVEGGQILFQADSLTEPLWLVPATESIARMPVGPARLVIETSARTFNRTMGTARAVQTKDGVPVRFTGMVLRIDRERRLLVVDVGYPVVAHDLGGRAADSLAPGSGVMFQAEGPARASSPS